LTEREQIVQARWAGSGGIDREQAERSCQRCQSA
jgi:hypothetical protein